MRLCQEAQVLHGLERTSGLADVRAEPLKLSESLRRRNNDDIRVANARCRLGAGDKLALGGLLTEQPRNEHLDRPLGDKPQFGDHEGEVRVVVEVQHRLAQRVGQRVDCDDEPEPAGTKMTVQRCPPRVGIEVLGGGLRHRCEKVRVEPASDAAGEVIDGHAGERARVLQHLPEYFASGAGVLLELALAEGDNAVLVDRYHVDAASVRRLYLPRHDGRPIELAGQHLGEHILDELLKADLLCMERRLGSLPPSISLHEQLHSLDRTRN